MKEKEKIIYTIRSGKIIKHRRTTTEWEEAKKFLEEAAKKSKDGIAYLDVNIDVGSESGRIISFPMAYAILDKQKDSKTNRKSNAIFCNPIYIDDIDKLKRPNMQIETNATFKDLLEKRFRNNYEK